MLTTKDLQEHFISSGMPVGSKRRQQSLARRLRRRGLVWVKGGSRPSPYYLGDGADVETYILQSLDHAGDLLHYCDEEIFGIVWGKKGLYYFRVFYHGDSESTREVRYALVHEGQTIYDKDLQVLRHAHMSSELDPCCCLRIVTGAPVF